MDEPDEISRPRTIDTVEYVRERINQIAELLEVVDNSALCLGEITSGPRTVFQRLPRHMRRRAMSHNIKRLPRLLRPIAIQNVSRTQHRKKAPSRLWRRRPSRLLKQNIREQRKTSWLTTHIWHAKRFHMQSLWGYRVPITSYQRGFRPNYRSSIHSAIIIDRSYLCCLQFVTSTNKEETNNQNLLIEVLSKFCQKKVSSTFSNVKALSSNFEMHTILFAPSKYPFGFIGPAKFSWSSQSKLNIWVHPSMINEFLKEISQFEDVKIDRTDDDTPAEKPIKLFNLRNHFCRFEMSGPNCLPYLHYALKPVSDDELTSLGLSEFREIHTWWNDSAPSIAAFNGIASYYQIPLLVEDPRLFRAQRQPQIVLQSTTMRKPKSPPSTPSHFLWDSLLFEQKFLPKRLSHADFEQLCAGRLAFPRRTDFKIPIILIFHGPSAAVANQNSLANLRIDFICPSAVGYDFWLAFQYANFRPIGLKDKTSLDFERGLITFPDDCPDSLAGIDHNETEATELSEKQQRKPHNQRINFEHDLNGLRPFNFDWEMLTKDTSKKELNVEDHSIYVLRDRLLLKQFDNWLKKCDQPEHDFDDPCLIPVSLKMFSKGVPKRLALICLPNKDDLEQLSQNRNRFPTRTGKYSKSTVEENHLQEDAIETGIPEYLPLIEDDTFQKEVIQVSKLVSLKELFPWDDEKRANKRRHKRRQILEKGEKTSQNEGNDACSSTTTEKVFTGINKSEDRQVIGRIVRGDYSFTSANGAAFGYISMAAVKLIGEKRIVLVRNITNKTFYPAHLSVNHSQTEI